MSTRQLWIEALYEEISSLLQLQLLLSGSQPPVKQNVNFSHSPGTGVKILYSTEQDNNLTLSNSISLLPDIPNCVPAL